MKKNYFKWVTDLNVRTKTTKFLKLKIENLWDLRVVRDFYIGNNVNNERKNTDKLGSIKMCASVLWKILRKQQQKAIYSVGESICKMYLKMTWVQNILTTHSTC